MEGWFRIHRKLLEHPLWLRKPFTPGQAWVDLIGLATYKPTYIDIRGNQIDLNRGDVGWSIRRLARRWKWSRNKVTRFLKWLENEHQIETQKTHVSAVITITNYERYQNTDHQTDHRRATEGPQTNH